VIPVSNPFTVFWTLRPWGFAVYTAPPLIRHCALTWVHNPMWLWASIILPPAALVIMPWIVEFRAALLANR